MEFLQNLLNWHHFIIADAKLPPKVPLGSLYGWHGQFLGQSHALPHVIDVERVVLARAPRQLMLHCWQRRSQEEFIHAGRKQQPLWASVWGKSCRVRGLLGLWAIVIISQQLVHGSPPSWAAPDRWVVVALPF